MGPMWHAMQSMVREVAKVTNPKLVHPTHLKPPSHLHQCAPNRVGVECMRFFGGGGAKRMFEKMGGMSGEGVCAHS